MMRSHLNTSISVRVRRPATAGVIAAILAAFVHGSGARAQSLNVTATVRDFLYRGTSEVVGGVTYLGHPDFEAFVGGDDRGIVADTLGVDNKPVYSSATVTTTTNGAAFFNQWYNSVPGVNQTTTTVLTATPFGTESYRYTNNAYFPIDNQLLGNQGAPHNYSFTSEIHTTFTYLTGQVFSFTGDDDVFVFINRRLAIDLGGVHLAETASVDLDAQASALGITPGDTYQLDIFQAERQTNDSDFAFTTNIALQDTATPTAAPEPATLALLTLGTLAGGIVIRRRVKTGFDRKA